MTMEYKHITRVIDNLDHLQARHIDSFDHDLLPDLETQCRERHLAIEQLETDIHILTGKAKLDQTEESNETLVFLMTRISGLLKQNRVLEKKVRTHKDGIENSLKTLATGKKIIHSYGSPAMTANHPRVISHTE
ncbi:hypothetical protein [Desulfobacula sp.]|uniref:hypothetical protein n=1 Tax=Desulfobacula sp. TaxID=2593537 RepID=UPI00261B3200|nr:hypothetical protein [Desulfobacula sp.]